MPSQGRTDGVYTSFWQGPSSHFGTSYDSFPKSHSTAEEGACKRFLLSILSCRRQHARVAVGARTGAGGDTYQVSIFRLYSC